MTLTEFRESLSESQPPAGLGLALAGLWWDAKGDWSRAHESAQQDVVAKMKAAAVPVADLWVIKPQIRKIATTAMQLPKMFR